MLLEPSPSPLLHVPSAKTWYFLSVPSDRFPGVCALLLPALARARLHLVVDWNGRTAPVAVSQSHTGLFDPFRNKRPFGRS
jgi:hypothetical protein